MYIHMAKWDYPIPIREKEEMITFHRANVWCIFGVSKTKIQLTKTNLRKRFENRKCVIIQTKHDDMPTVRAIPSTATYDSIKMGGYGNFLVFGYFDLKCFSTGEASYMEIYPISMEASSGEAREKVKSLSDGGAQFERCEYGDGQIAQVLWRGYSKLQLYDI